MIEPRVGQSLLDILKDLGYMQGRLSTDPIVAKIAGRVFTLNYIPVRQQDVEPDRKSIKTAVKSSGGHIKLMRYYDAEGREAYIKTAQFVIFLAFHRLYPNGVVKMSCTLGNAINFKVSNLNNFCLLDLISEMNNIVGQDILLNRRRIAIDDAIEHYKQSNQVDKTRLLKYRGKPYFSVYEHDGFADYFYGEMAPSTGFLHSWNIVDAPNGFTFILPDINNPDCVAKYTERPNFFNVYSEGEAWSELMKCETVADLNELTESGKIRELIRVNEALHEKRFSQIADMICERGAKAVMLAGPSSSGKTTSANRLSIQLRVHGKDPILMSLDDYYFDRDKIEPGPDGKIDLEHINTIDTELFGQHLKALFNGEEIEIPTFSFKLGKRVWTGHKMKLQENSVIIVEGIHGLNPSLIPSDLDSKLVFKLFVSPLLPLNFDNHNRIPTSTLRLLRRTVRDFENRGSSVQRTLEMWDSVRRGEEKWIFPYQEDADVIFNSSTLYELAIIKPYIYPLLQDVSPKDECYEQVRAMIGLLNYVREANVEDEIPPTSIVREFIGGNSFYK